jgi:hypothetical protein
MPQPALQLDLVQPKSPIIRVAEHLAAHLAAGVRLVRRDVSALLTDSFGGTDAAGRWSQVELHTVVELAQLLWLNAAPTACWNARGRSRASRRHSGRRSRGTTYAQPSKLCRSMRETRTVRSLVVSLTRCQAAGSRTHRLPMPDRVTPGRQRPTRRHRDPVRRQRRPARIGNLAQPGHEDVGARSGGRASGGGGSGRRSGKGTAGAAESARADKVQVVRHGTLVGLSAPCARSRERGRRLSDRPDRHSPSADRRHCR